MVEHSFCIIDVETTGGRYNEDRITEIAIIIYQNGKIVEEYKSLVNPCRPIDSFVVSLTGISDRMVANAPLFSDISEKILNLTENRIFVAHNVQFDYNVIRREFSRIGINFTRKQLCTVKLSRKILPGYKSYSLGKICEDLKIPNHSRHRAYGDALATTSLLEIILENDRERIINSLIEEEISDNLLPPNLTIDIVSNIPEEKGVYHFLDQNRKVLYVGKSKNIRKKVLTHFSEDIEKKFWIKIKNYIYDVHFQTTGSDLLSEIIESEEICRLKPSFNISKGRRSYRYAMILSIDQDGYHFLSIESIESPKQHLKKFISKVEGQRFVDSFLAKNVGSPAFKKILSFDAYNKLVIKAIDKISWTSNDSLILFNKNMQEETGFLLIEENEVKGYGFFEKDFSIQDFNDLNTYTQLIQYSEEAKNILLKHLSKNKESFKVIYKKNT